MYMHQSVNLVVDQFSLFLDTISAPETTSSSSSSASANKSQGPDSRHESATHWHASNFSASSESRPSVFTGFEPVSTSAATTVLLLPSAASPMSTIGATPAAQFTDLTEAVRSSSTSPMTMDYWVVFVAGSLFGLVWLAAVYIVYLGVKKVYRVAASTFASTSPVLSFSKISKQETFPVLIAAPVLSCSGLISVCVEPVAAALPEIFTISGPVTTYEQKPAALSPVKPIVPIAPTFAFGGTSFNFAAPSTISFEAELKKQLEDEKDLVELREYELKAAKEDFAVSTNKWVDSMTTANETIHKLRTDLAKYENTEVEETTARSELVASKKREEALKERVAVAERMNTLWKESEMRKKASVEASNTTGAGAPSSSGTSPATSNVIPLSSAITSPTTDSPTTTTTAPATTKAAKNAAKRAAKKERKKAANEGN